MVSVSLGRLVRWVEYPKRVVEVEKPRTDTLLAALEVVIRA